MAAKEYLEYVRSLDTRLRIKELEIAQLRKDICSIQALDYSKDKITGGSPIDISGKIAKLDELIRKANDDWDTLIVEREKAKSLIDELENPRQREVLTRRFIQNEKWEVVAVNMDITWQCTWKLYGRALKSFQKIF